MRPRRPIHKVSLASELHINARCDPASSNRRSFLRPADTWDTENEPRAPPSRRNRTLAASSVSIDTGSPPAADAPLNVSTSPCGRYRTGMNVCRSAQTSVTRRPEIHDIRSSQCEPMSATERRSPARSESKRQFQSVSSNNQSW